MRKKLVGVNILSLGLLSASLWLVLQVVEVNLGEVGVDFEKMFRKEKIEESAVIVVGDGEVI